MTRTRQSDVFLPFHASDALTVRADRGEQHEGAVPELVPQVPTAQR